MPDVPFLLSSAAACREFLGTTARVFDTELNALLYSLSDRIARHCNRASGLDQFVESKSRTEDHDVRTAQREFWLRAPPIASITSVSFDEERDFGSGTALDAGDYEFDAATGRLRIRYALHPNPYPERYLSAARIVYIGGIAATLPALRSYAPTLELALQLWVKDILARQRFGPGEGSVGGGGRSRSAPAMMMPKIVEQLLAPYVLDTLGLP